ncbi:hypothetical protein MVEN_00118700 [Mycena venus]|uniref:Rhodopsin domain-containing protein n=1 Tax=Mycena venus TaxID=2733690 RepID=A0A8H6ZA60_9AGAR|nr:hypothetical protein MVEN_00118700 [Mycena venus]
MINPTGPLVQLKITSVTCSFFALGMTAYRQVTLSLICVGLTDASTRLYKRRGRLWADDAWVFFAFVFLIIQLVGVFLHVPVPNNLTRTTRVSAYYQISLTFYSVVWASRLSILFSIVRIHPLPSARKHLSWVAVSFVTAVLFFFGQLLWVCETEPLWKDAPNHQCHLPLQVAICQLVMDVLADSILLFAPLHLFRSLSDKMLRRRLTLIFSTCVVTTIVSLVHAAFILRNGGIKEIIAGSVEGCLSLIVANVPVIVAAIMPHHDRETDEVQTLETRSMRFNPVSRKLLTNDLHHEGNRSGHGDDAHN